MNFLTKLHQSAANVRKVITQNLEHLVNYAQTGQHHRLDPQFALNALKTLIQDTVCPVACVSPDGTQKLGHPSAQSALLGLNHLQVKIVSNAMQGNFQFKVQEFVTTVPLERSQKQVLNVLSVVWE